MFFLSAPSKKYQGDSSRRSSTTVNDLSLVAYSAFLIRIKHCTNTIFVDCDYLCMFIYNERLRINNSQTYLVKIITFLDSDFVEEIRGCFVNNFFIF